MFPLYNYDSKAIIYRRIKTGFTQQIPDCQDFLTNHKVLIDEHENNSKNILKWF